MTEYDLMCDACGSALAPHEATVAWIREGDTERAFTLTHDACVRAGATQRAEVRTLVWPNEFLRFTTDRFSYRIGDPDELRAIVWALAPFVVRHDNPAEMDGMRAASFGARPGVKPGADAAAPHAKEAVEARGDVHSGK